MTASPSEYVKHGFVLVPIKAGSKGPRTRGWNKRENCISKLADAFNLAGQNIGLAHAYSGTCAIDIDDVKQAIPWLSEKGIDLIEILMRDDTVQIDSGRDNRSKLLYRLPNGVDPLPQKKIQVDAAGDVVVGNSDCNHDMIDFRCGTANGLTVQDLLPESVHPDTGKKYQWIGDWRKLPTLPDVFLAVWRKLASDNATGGKADAPDDWAAVELETLGLSAFTKRLIREGIEGTKYKDRSTALYGALKDLVRVNADDSVICRVLCDPANQISDKPLEAHGGDIHKAMRWVANQIGKARAEVSGESDADKVINLPIELNEDSLAMAFAAAHASKLRFDHTRGRWYRWDGKRWRVDETKIAFHWARELCRQANKRADRPEKTISKVRTAAEVEKAAKSDPKLAVTERYWNNDPWLLATPAGTVDLRTGRLREADPMDHITMTTSIGPQSVSTPLWSAFLNQATGGDESLMHFLQQIAGYCLTGNTQEHALFFIYGPGGNGKGVLVNTLMLILGDYAMAAPMSTFTASRFDQHPTDLADLAGARMVTASETEEGRAWAESRIKQMTGGDPIKARFMRQDFFQYQPEFKLVFLGNHKPVIRNVDNAARRRFNIIPFTHVPEKPDFHLEQKLKREHGGILQWAIDGCLDWQKNGLVRPEIVTQATEQYFSDQDLFTQFLDEMTEKKSHNFGERTTALFKVWTAYAEAAGEKPGTRPSFRERMRAAGYVFADHLPGDHNGKGFIGIQLTTDSVGGYQPYAD